MGIAVARSTILFGSLSAALLAATYFEPALGFAGEYAGQKQVQVGVFVCLVVPYAIAFSLGALAFDRAFRLPHLILRGSIAVLGCLCFHYVLLIAPVASYIALGSVCRIQQLCPEYANPIAWATSGTVYPGPPSFAPNWLVVLAPLRSWYLQRNQLHQNDA
jgi:hypothetical protein